MIIDSSAVVSIIRSAPDAEVLGQAILDAPRALIGAPNVLETDIVLLGRYGMRGHTHLSRFLQQFQVETVPFTAEHAEVAHDAYARFGKGRHPAKLNFGDCVAYATARIAGEPLLYIGNDFPLTDLELVDLKAMP